MVALLVLIPLLAPSPDGSLVPLSKILADLGAAGAKAVLCIAAVLAGAPRNARLALALALWRAGGRAAPPRCPLPLPSVPPALRSPAAATIAHFSPACRRLNLRCTPALPLAI